MKAGGQCRGDERVPNLRFEFRPNANRTALIAEAESVGVQYTIPLAQIKVVKKKERSKKIVVEIGGSEGALVFPFDSALEMEEVHQSICTLLADFYE